MLTSKEIIERTGISRATLNNYIASGLVPRPQVLPPGPEHGAAPRIGYFPDDTIARIETIQRFKREGWSITRIAEHLAAHPPAPDAAAPAPAVPVPAPAVPARGASVTAPIADPSGRLWLRDIRHPAYIVDESFRVVWMNDEARSAGLSPLSGPADAGTSVFASLLEIDPAKGRDAILRFHLAVARQRSTDAADLFRDLPAADAAALEAMLRDARSQDARLVSHAVVPAGPGVPARLAYAVHLRDGVLFAYAPGTAAETLPAAPRANGKSPAAPVLTPVAVLVASLQDANGLWVRLTAQEYFELLNEVWTELDRIFRRHHGVRGAQTGEVLVCYFLPSEGQSYLGNALAAAQQTRDAMRQVSRRWHLRKSWDIELAMNVGVDEGQEWMGGVGSAALGAVRVLGDAPDRAEQLARSARMGAVLLTRSLVGKLPPGDLQRATYGVPAQDGSEARVLFTFARLEDIASPSTVPARFADLAVAELLDLKFPNPDPGAGGAV
ncbi:MAG TPA: adenylate/guanylate cyclase domain-containing protein [Ramlibacter sp.]|uniref:MerR family transcriptional regulator n=1 Tax=Ramlibacter sp. TaxID=1917967 RepID=UPI002ED4EC0C